MMKLQYLVPVLALSWMTVSCSDKVDEVQEHEEVIPEVSGKDTSRTTAGKRNVKQVDLVMVATPSPVKAGA